MKEADVLRCQIQEWYPRFRRASIKTAFVCLPEEFVSFLLQDGVFLSRSSNAMPSRTTVRCPELQAENYHRWEEEDAEQDEPELPTFPELEQKVVETIEALGGAVFPKLNWSSPSDAAWISTTGSLRCNNFGEISLLLKASDNIVYDLKHAFEGCEDKSRDRPETFHLALRKWYDLRPEMEFRGFVKGGVLVGVCQREVTSFYSSLREREKELEVAIGDFFEEVLRGKFQAHDYTFDCYVLKDFRVKLIDFSPWGGSTLPLLFSWEELETKSELATSEVHVAAAGEAPTIPHDASQKLETIQLEQREKGKHPGYSVDFRIVMSEGLVQPGVRSCSGVPFDFVETGPGSAWDDFFRRADAEIKQQATDAFAGA